MILREITAKLSSCKTRSLIAVVVCFLFFPTFIVNAALKLTPSQPPQTNKRIQIVIINSGNQDLPMEREISLGLKKKLKSTLVNADVYQEYLDSARFNEKLQSDIFYDYLKNKYQIKPVDVVISNGIPAANFLSKHPNLFKELKHIFVRSGGAILAT